MSLAATLGEGTLPRTGGWEKQSANFRGVISLSAPYELEKLSWGGLWTPAAGNRKPALPEQKEQGISDSLAARRLASPIRHVGANTRPMLILHSDNDGSVPVQQAVDMAETLEKAKVRHRLSLYQKKGHMRVTDDVIKEARAFMEEIGKEKP